jgi:sigma-B regulation protein RsbU (phosphoserine phosphatase)
MGNSEKQTTILIVDDSEPIRKLINAYLREGGYRVVEAVDGQAGLEFCLQLAPDLILLDIVMPKMDGFSLCARLQNDVNLRQIPIIMLSARDDTESKMRSFELGAVDYIMKPVSKGELLARIKTHLTISRLTYSLQEANRELLVNQEQLLQGLHAAADLQKNLLPKRVPNCKKLHFSSYFNPCREVGGDIYNIQRLDSEHLAIYILDVSGHGFPAAMMTALATQALSGACTISPPKHGSDEGAAGLASPGEVVWGLNKEFPIDRFNLYLTIIYLLFNTRDFSFRYCCAGHPPLVHVTSEGDVNLLDTGGPPVGMDGTWNEGEGRLERGDRLFFYTDGLIEYCNEGGEFYGQKRLVESMGNSRDLPLQAAVQNVIGELKQFGGQVDADDDMTLLAVEKN